MNSLETNKLLKELGLNTSEIEIYKTLLKSGAASYASLVEISKIPRTTIIENIEKLIEKDLVVETINSSKRKFQAEDPSKLKLLIVDKKLTLESEIKKFDDLELKLPYLVSSILSSATSDESPSVPNIKIYRGRRKVWSMYEETLKAEIVYSFCDIDKFYEVFPGTKAAFVKAYDNNRSRRVFDILLDTALSREISTFGHPSYKVKFLPHTSFFAGFVFGDYMIFDGKVALVQLDIKNPSVVIIESQDLFLGFEGLHKTMWELL